MVQGVKVQKDQGTPQGGPLSPLLANVMLDEVDRELERRGHEFVRYADDCNVYVKTRRAGQRVLQTLRRCYAKLRLVVNEAKTAVAPVWGRKFLGYSLVVGQGGARLVVAKQALDKLRDRLRRSTRRSSGRSLAQIAEELRAYVPGWKAYFRLAPMPSVRRELDSWLRHRLRAVQLAHWRRGRTAYPALRKLGARVDEAQRIASHLRQWWHTSALGVNRLLPLAYLDRLGVPRFS
ncbi:MAG: hypothetical protein HS128_04325 [Ideonella sp.]|nr:hypothetical protein [Ideonella sp.]